MLTVKFESNQECLKNLYESLNIADIKGANFVLYDEDKAIGLWRMLILSEYDGSNDECIALVDKIVFAENVIEGDKEFFMRAMLFKLQQGAPVLLRVEGINDKLKVFGFENVNGNMEINSKNINLHCKH